MKNLFLFFLLFQNCFAQSTIPFEEKIYESIDAFVANPSVNAANNLSIIEKEFYTKSRTKSEFLALVILKCNKGYYLNRLGKTNWSIRSYEQAWTIYKTHKLSNYDIIESCLKPLGNLYTITGELQNAENTIKEYYFLSNLEVKNTENKSHKISAILNLSAVYLSGGKNQEAIQLIENAIQSEVLSPIQKGKFYNNLGNNYLIQGKFSKAAENFKKSIFFLEDKKNTGEELSNAYKNLAQVYQKQNKFSLALATYEKAKMNLIQSSNCTAREIAKLYYIKALILYQSQNEREASLILDTIFETLIPNLKKEKTKLPKQEQLYPDSIFIEALDLKAKLYVSQNNPIKALESYHLSFYVENLLQSNLFYEDSKIIAQIKSRSRAEECISILYELYKKEKNKTYLEEAFQWSEYTKSAVLNNAVNAKSKSTIEEQKLLSKIQELNSIIITEQLKIEKANINIINNAIAQQNIAMLRLKELKKSNQNVIKKIDLEALYKKIETENVSLVSYFFGSKNIYIFNLTDKEIVLSKLDYLEKTKSTTRRFIDFFNQSDNILNAPIAFNQTSFELYQLLQIDKIKPKKNTLIIPDGLLNFVPFESLITQNTKTINFSKIPFFVYKTQLTYNNSATFYLNSKKYQTKMQNILGIFPIFNNTNLSLPYSEKEYQYLSGNFSGKFFKNKEATFSNFSTNCNHYDILHLSTHANSGDIYEPAQIKFSDRDVLFSELYPIKTQAKLVVLSACETGIGKMYNGEGFMSVARGFQMAGAQNLVFSLWKVNDFTTFKIIENFYKNLKEGKNYTEANQKSKIDYLKDESIPNAKKSPYYWSAMVYYGTIEKENTAKKWIYLSIFTFILVVILLLINKKRIFLKG